MSEIVHQTRGQLEAGLELIREAPTNRGALELLVRRPEMLAREVIVEGELHPDHGLVGDNWATRGSRFMEDGSSHPEMQLNVMSARVIALFAQDRENWPLAGDQLYLDLDLSVDNLPAGTQLAIGSSVIEVTKQPHLGCAKFVERFGSDAMKFVNSDLGKQLRLRGLNAKVVRGGGLRIGDLAEKI